MVAVVVVVVVVESEKSGRLEENIPCMEKGSDRLERTFSSNGRVTKTRPIYLHLIVYRFVV